MRYTGPEGVGGIALDAVGGYAGCEIHRTPTGPRKAGLRTIGRPANYLNVRTNGTVASQARIPWWPPRSFEPERNGIKLQFAPFTVTFILDTDGQPELLKDVEALRDHVFTKASNATYSGFLSTLCTPAGVEQLSFQTSLPVIEPKS